MTLPNRVVHERPIERVYCGRRVTDRDIDPGPAEVLLADLRAAVARSNRVRARARACAAAQRRRRAARVSRYLRLTLESPGSGRPVPFATEDDVVRLCDRLDAMGDGAVPGEAEPSPVAILVEDIDVLAVEVEVDRRLPPRQVARDLVTLRAPGAPSLMA